MLNGFILRLLKGPIHALDDDDTSWPEIEEVNYGFSGKADEHRRKQERVCVMKFTKLIVMAAVLSVPSISLASTTHDCEHTAALWANIQKARQSSGLSYDEFMHSYIEGYVHHDGKSKGLASPESVARIAHHIYKQTSINRTPQKEFNEVYKICKAQHKDIINQWVKH